MKVFLDEFFCNLDESVPNRGKGIFFKGTCTKSPCEYLHLPECQPYNSESACKIGAECLFPHWKFEEQPNKKPKKGDDKSAAAIVKSVRQLSCVSQDSEPPESVEGTKCWYQFDEYDSRGLHCVKQTSEKKKGSRLKKKSQNSPSASPHAMKFEDRSPGKTARQEGCARGDAWTLAKNVFKLKKEDKATCDSPSDEWILPAASTIKPEEREFVVDSGASMHMVSEKDIDKAELETVRISKNPTTVVTANGEVLAKEEATENVRELHLFVTVLLLEDTAAVLSFTWKTLRRTWV